MSQEPVYKYVKGQGWVPGYETSSLFRPGSYITEYMTVHPPGLTDSEIDSLCAECVSCQTTTYGQTLFVGRPRYGPYTGYRVYVSYNPVYFFSEREARRHVVSSILSLEAGVLPD